MTSRCWVGKILEIINIREHPEYLDRAVDYFASKWWVPRIVYQDAISHSITTDSPLPRWYLTLKGDTIIGSFGLINNDFNSRQDLYPWLCALYVEESERGHALGARLLEYGRAEAAKLGFNKLYISTGHIGYYERYGCEYIGNSYGADSEPSRIYEIATEWSNGFE